MGDRYAKKIELAIDTQTITASGEVESSPVYTYNYTRASLLVDISGSGSGDMDIELQASPDQGTTWFTLDNATSGISIVSPSQVAYSDIPVPGAYTRVKVAGDPSMTGSYVVSVYLVLYV